MHEASNDQLCPNCGSTNVRWRNRRFYDVLFTWCAEAFYNSAVWSNDGCALIYQVPPETYPQAVRYDTPHRFWRCLDCRRRGDEFDVLRTPSEQPALPVEEPEPERVRELIGAGR
jgi:hypothetical protein